MELWCYFLSWDFVTQLFAVCLTWSLSSVCPRSLPLAWAILFPDTRFPTITEAGPISATHRQNQQQLPTRLPPKNPEQTLTHLAVSAAVWAGWWHRCGGTSGHCRGAAPPPGTAAWSPTGGCRPEESWEGCWPAPEPDRRRPPRGCCLWPESHEGVWSDYRWDLTSPWGNLLCWE